MKDAVAILPVIVANCVNEVIRAFELLARMARVTVRAAAQPLADPSRAAGSAGEPTAS